MTRIATSTTYTKSVSYLQKNNVRLDRVSDQYNTGLKFRTAGDAPADYAATLRLEKDITMYEQYNTNSGYAVDALNLEETALTSLNERLDRAQVLITSGINASYSQDEFESVAAELSEIQEYILGLMNTQTTEGEYIFSGSLGRTQSFVNVSGSYVYQGDSGQRQLNASSSVAIPVSDPGFIFQVDTARDISTTNGNVHVGYDNYSSMLQFCEDMDRSFGVSAHTLTFTRDPSNENLYTVTDPLTGSNVSVMCKKGVMDYRGVSIVPNGEASFDVTFSAPQPQDNVLNSFTAAINAFNDSTLSEFERNVVLNRVTTHITNTQNSINKTLGRIGARQNTLDTVINSNQEIEDVKKEAKATISEVDLYETTSELAKTNSILQMSMKSFNYMTGTSLFDYIS
jgi:flagellar hook-associated protein 3 FlgL